MCYYLVSISYLIYFQNHDNVILIFSVKESGKFQGIVASFFLNLQDN